MNTNTSSFWTDAPRDHFSALCIEHFGHDFNCCPTFTVRADQITVARRAPKRGPMHGPAPKRVNHGSSTRASALAIQRGGNLIAEAGR